MWKLHNPKFEYEAIYSDWAWPWAGHKNFIYDFVVNLKPKKIVELGTHRGTSFFSMCQAIKDHRLDLEIYAIDTWKGDKHAGYYGEEIISEVKQICKRYYSDINLHLIRKTFNAALKDFNNNSIDLLHIDGLHTYIEVKRDFENWLPKVNKDGIIIFHDIAERQRDFGVYKLWDELKEKYKTMEVYHSHGLGILFKSDKNYLKLSSFENLWQIYYEKVYNAEFNKNRSDYIKEQNLQQSEQLNKMNSEINNFKSAKIYKIWQMYNLVKHFFFKNKA